MHMVQEIRWNIRKAKGLWCIVEYVGSGNNKRKAVLASHAQNGLRIVTTVDCGVTQIYLCWRLQPDLSIFLAFCLSNKNRLCTHSFQSYWPRWVSYPSQWRPTMKRVNVRIALESCSEWLSSAAPVRIGEKLAPFNPTGDVCIAQALDMLQVRYSHCCVLWFLISLKSSTKMILYTT